MKSWASSPAVRRNMQANRGRDTSPELAIRSLLHARGLRYRVNAPLEFDRRRRADITFPRLQLAIFIDGCYWHGCVEHFQTPKTNMAFWLQKIGANQTRDRHTDGMLRAAGWTVLRFWEHEKPELVADQIAETVGQLREPRT
ncbi:T/G mismatch-specific endonuclease [Kribbella sp. VKM Ac-2568]|nr:T/G mismatch-specific endonuclease [Kribbella sp. VKM Ac-2568]